MISTSITNNSATIVITDAAGKSTVYPLNRTHINYDAVIDAVRNNDEATIHKLCNVAKTLENFVEGKVRVENGHVYYGNLLLDGIVVDRILSFIKHKLPVQPMLRFINKLYENPSARAINELYKFLEHKNMPITPSGNFLAYKGVQSDFFSKTAGEIEVIKGKVVDGKIYNDIGQEIEVMRNQVCDNKDIGCSKGLHAGSLKYATNFGSHGKVVIVEINPAHVVSIPSDCECQKLRTCAYKVVGEFEVPLNDNYCNAYSSYGDDSDDDSDDDGCSDSDDCEAEEYGPIVNLSYNNGFEKGYTAATSKKPFDNVMVAYDYEDCPKNSPEALLSLFSDAWHYGYQSGYDDGIVDRSNNRDW
jgi:hypothetical protein